MFVLRLAGRGLDENANRYPLVNSVEQLLHYLTALTHVVSRLFNTQTKIMTKVF